MRMTMEKATKWLNEKSEFYSEIAEFRVTHREVLLVNGIALCVILAAMMAEGAIWWSLVPIGLAAYMVRLLNRKK